MKPKPNYTTGAGPWDAADMVRRWKLLAEREIPLSQPPQEAQQSQLAALIVDQREDRVADRERSIAAKPKTFRRRRRR